ncbi:TPA: hypothetical protein QHU55_002533 [Klebsiella aerogenes]|uniref:hypothetical protein n=1 Tax=Klebsiella aerogenes TaxID=548 RepID=UPI002756DFCD|nr:hypothetical protein [Klebsiella aerogenes]HDS6533981.1 hypothetical protein [Klebsiella aerogenes]HDS7500243.1 hypothetical protein [Klebsiella aerogenes]HDS9641893.1 hypothetical protein [Klebsiella aerogenes]HDT0788023.1 hypothetical protein [Klebsiella aerogenes]
MSSPDTLPERYIRSDPFIETLMKYTPVIASAFDLGAGNGDIASLLLKAGIQMKCLDFQSRPPHVSDDVLWISRDFRRLNDSWLTLIDAEILICRNVLHFYRREWVSKTLFPTLLSAMPSLKYIALQAFNASPQPAFDIAQTSYWTPTELTILAPGFKMHTTDETVVITPDVNGDLRTFFLSMAFLTKIFPTPHSS